MVQTTPIIIHGSAEIANEINKRAMAKVFGNLPPRVEKPKVVRDLDARAICELFNVFRSTVRRWTARGCPCERHGNGKRLRFNESEVAAWLESNRLTGTIGRPAVSIANTIDKYGRATSREICRAFCIGRRQLSRWTARGCPWVQARGRRKLFNVVAVFRWLQREWPEGRLQYGKVVR